MGWKSNKKIRDLEPYCRDHGYSYTVAFCVADDGRTCEVNTYGKTAKLCKAAEIAGDQLLDQIKSGDWPKWSDLEPISQASLMLVRIRAAINFIEGEAEWSKPLDHVVALLKGEAR